MKEISIQQVEDLAKLARLGLTEQEKTSIAKEMTEILNYAQSLNEVNTENVQPTNQVTGLDNVFRIDQKIDSDIPIESRLGNTPSVEDNFIKVKKVLD
ncbi:MAG: Asp-tRNA(Asn)/Glu-tRNA(Gln) amidotransferase subunit GatC [Patescibacteria group bacterium]|nr:Asp-tRNA(Asn)/Glu-tRNA(Gln) amidotransferase subunit GatC [Patescibacteria group bacterium]